MLTFFHDSQIHSANPSMLRSPYYVCLLQNPTSPLRYRCPGYLTSTKTYQSIDVIIVKGTRWNSRRTWLRCARCPSAVSTTPHSLQSNVDAKRYRYACIHDSLKVLSNASSVGGKKRVIDSRSKRNGEGKMTKAQSVKYPNPS